MLGSYPLASRGIPGRLNGRSTGLQLAVMEDLADPEVGRRPRRGGRGGAALRAQAAHSLSGNSSTHARATAGRVLVLNASYEPINVCTVRRAAVLVLKSRAEMLEKGEGALHSERLELDRPCVIRLVRYVRIPRDVHRRKITRKAVLARDSYTCQYCGREATGLTVDHVIPRSRGGRVGVGEHRRLLRALQPQEGQPDAARGPDASGEPAPAAGPDGVHPDRRAPGPRGLGAVPDRGLA